MTLPHDQIQEFHKQWYLLKDNALEVFLASGKTSLLALNSTKVCASLVFNNDRSSFSSDDVADGAASDVN
jgi:hypothetical protein